MKFAAVVAPAAKQDFEAILHWLAQRSPQGAARWVMRFNRMAESLSENPDRFGSAPEAEFVDRDVKQVLFKTRRGRTYRALFEITGQTVNILRIRGPNQDLLDPNTF